jgi:hypothetical protein
MTTLLKFSIPDQDFIKLLIKKNYDNHYTTFFATFLNEENYKDSKYLFSQCWKIIHSMHNQENLLQLVLFVKILKLITHKKCSCTASAYEIFFGLLNNNIETFLNLNNTKEFWILFHNLINIKLSKEIFISKID